MMVSGMGNVTECNYLWIFLNNEGKQDRLKANRERLLDIFHTAIEDQSFYDRMGKVLTEEYERRKAQAEAKYHYITDEMVQEAYKEDHKKGFYLSLSKDSNNEECLRQFSYVFGLYDGAKLAHDRYWEAYKLARQAKDALGRDKGVERV